jgi:acetyltransferase
MVRFSQLVVEQTWIKELDFNPLLASPDRLLALDARVVLHDPSTPEDQLPKPAIRPYPNQYVKTCTSEKGEKFTVRPITAEDEPDLANFHKHLSERTVYMRFFSNMKLGQRIAHERLSRIAFIDYNREMTLVATTEKDGEQIIVGAGRLIKSHGRAEAEFSLLIQDEYQGHGIGSEMLRHMVRIGEDEKLKRIIGYVLSENMGMLKVTDGLGFSRHALKDDPNIIRVVKEL